jgi:uncharacterized damage-inducible protein DinB
MKKTIALSLFLLALTTAWGQIKTRDILLAELKSTHDQANWFVPLNNAIDGLSAKQASWKPAADSHSVGELVHHLLYWNQRQLKTFKGEAPGDRVKDNKETFDKFEEGNWVEVCKQLQQVMTEFESWVKTASDADLNAKMEVLSNICTHNAYHIGQMVYVRKLQGSWATEKGVKE